MTEFDVGEKTYRVGKIDARRQWHLVRRVAPALVGVVGIASLTNEEGQVVNPRAMIEKIEPFLAALGKMSDEDTDYVLDTCLSVVQRKIEGDRGWSSVGSGGALMFDDIDLAVMMRLAFEAGRENLSGFFDALQSMFQAAPTAA